MSHWAELDDKNYVIKVTVGDNNDPNGDEGYKWLIDNLGGKWIKTSYNGNIRKNYASTGYFYDETRDAFIPPKLFDEWILNEETCQWELPVPYPTDGKDYIWNHNNKEWEEYNDTTSN
jgi:hypothetical protein